MPVVIYQIAPVATVSSVPHATKPLGSQSGYGVTAPTLWMPRPPNILHTQIFLLNLYTILISEFVFFISNPI